MRDLISIESYIADQPDSALTAIRQVDTTTLRAKAVKAKYALLHAMALDKNYIDTADARIIMPAVDYFEKHGSPEEKLKALMYLGVEQYNAGFYNQAIVSFYRASEYAPKVNDFNLLGILYSRMADTYTMTRDYSQAEEYIDKSIDSFRYCQKRKQEHLELARKAHNLAQQKKWNEAEALYESLLNDTLSNHATKAQLEIDYAMCLLYSPSDKLPLAYHLMTDGISLGVKLNNEDQIGALAFLKDHYGEKTVSDSLLSLIHGHHKNHYWKHRIKLNYNDYKGAYDNLLLSSQSLDSLINIISVNSAANAQKLFLDLSSRVLVLIQFVHLNQHAWPFVQ